MIAGEMWKEIDKVPFAGCGKGSPGFLSARTLWKTDLLSQLFLKLIKNLTVLSRWEHLYIGWKSI